VSDDRVKVLYIMSGTRSGSTILDQILGELDGFFSTGELRFVWERGLLEDRTCGCRRPVRECEVWSAVLSADAGVDEPLEKRSAEDVVRLQHESLRLRHTWRVLRRHREDLDGPLAHYAPVADQLYRAVHDVTGARVIVDSSKHPSDAALLPLLPTIDPYVVHLVRDPRAVVHSWQRKREEPDRPGDAEMPTWSLPKTALNWDAVNLAANAVRRAAGDRAILLRYQDLVHDPQDAIRRIATLVGEHPATLPFLDDHTVRLRPNHTVSGNPSRFRIGDIVLREDDEWIRAQSTTDRWLATLLTLPLLRGYGLPLRARA
jgi:hypothetical protein